MKTDQAGAARRAAQRIAVTCRFFARYAELAGREELEMTVASGATVGDLIEALRRHPSGASRLPATMLVAVNMEHARMTHVLADGDEVALLPPLAGG